MRSRCRCSMCPAIHINSRSWLRSSSTHEPSDPPLRVVLLVSPVCVSRQQRARVDRRSEERLRCLLPELDFRVGLRVRKQFVHRGAAEKPLFEPSQGRNSVRRIDLAPASENEFRTQVPRDADETCKVWDSGNSPAAIAAGGRSPIFPYKP